jgi:signal transduction histidine kinase/CheY-like chemotaxis protein
MAEELIERDEGAGPSPWRGLWASLAALLATLLLIALIVAVTLANRARDRALSYERQTQEIVLLTRTVDATIARAEAALGRYVLDEDERTGTAYYNEWRSAGWQIGRLQRLVRDDADQSARVTTLRGEYDRRGEELALAANAAFRGQGTGGLGLFFQAARSDSLTNLRRTLEEIARAARANLRARQIETQSFAAQANAFAEWLGWLAAIVGIGAVGLAWLAWRAFTEGRIAAGRAESESWRALELEQAVQERTRELSEANERLRAEAAERAAAEAQLRQVQKMEAVGQLTGGIAHDFNNMLAVIVGGLDLARRKLHGPAREAEFHIDNAMEGAHRAAALTRRLLAFARAEPLLPEGVAPSELVEGMLDLIDRTIGERIAVRTRFAEEPWHVFADPNQLENAIVNLCVNARDAMDGKGELRIEVANVHLREAEIDDLAAGDYVRIAVADTGSGIAPEHLERVFEPFFTTKPVGKGTGLGLSQIFGFARQSGGDVTIRSELGKGTEVAIYLPRSAGAAEAVRRPAPAPRAEPLPVTRGARILVVEDDPRVARATVGALEELGHRPIACASGREALDLLEREEGIALVVTDVMMPEMTGPELARHVRARWGEIGLLFVTGYVGEAGDAPELAEAALLRKPFTVAQLAEAIAAALPGEISAPPRAAAGGGAR